MRNPGSDDHRAHVMTLVRAALASADAGSATLRAWPRDLHGQRIRLVAIGKASVAMTRAVLERGLAVIDHGVVVGLPGTLHGLDHLGGASALDLLEADHPSPTHRSVHAGECVKQLITTPSRSPIILLLSGGASAMVCTPAHGLTVNDIGAMTSALMKAGARIEELNCVRRHCEELKGGGFARAARGARIDTIVLSDVISGEIASIGSGPTAADPTTYLDALTILESHGCGDACPAVTSAMRRGASGTLIETVKPGDPVTDTVNMIVAGSNVLATHAVEQAASALGFAVVEMSNGVVGDASEIGAAFARRLIDVSKTLGPRPRCIIAGGETTVRVTGSGRGGRNQELALAAAIELDRHPGLVVASFATDGIDGASPHAGAIASSTTLDLARKKSLDPHESLQNNDSSTFFEQVGSAITTGPTGTNVNDVWIGIAYPYAEGHSYG